MSHSQAISSWANRLKSLERLAIISLLAISAIINVGLSQKIRANANAPATRRGTLAVGSPVPSLVFRTIEGDRLDIDFKASKVPTVLYFMSPSCPACAKNLANMRALVEQAGDRYNFVGIAGQPDGVREYVNREKLAFPIYVTPEETLERLRMSTVPATYVIDTSGILIQQWSGAFQGSQKAVEEFFSVTLPGLTKIPVNGSPR